MKSAWLCVSTLLAISLHSTNAITTLIKATDLVHYGCGDVEYMGGWVVRMEEEESSLSSLICYATLVSTTGLLTTRECIGLLLPYEEGEIVAVTADGVRRRIVLTPPDKVLASSPVAMIRLSDPIDFASSSTSPLIGPACILPARDHDQEGPFLHESSAVQCPPPSDQKRLCVSPSEVPDCRRGRREYQNAPGFPLMRRANLYRAIEESRYYVTGLSVAGGCRDRSQAVKFRSLMSVGARRQVVQTVNAFIRQNRRRIVPTENLQESQRCPSNKIVTCGAGQFLCSKKQVARGGRQLMSSSSSLACPVWDCQGSKRVASLSLPRAREICDKDSQYSPDEEEKERSGTLPEEYEPRGGNNVQFPNKVGSDDDNEDDDSAGFDTLQNENEARSPSNPDATTTTTMASRPLPSLPEQSPSNDQRSPTEERILTQDDDGNGSENKEEKDCPSGFQFDRALANCVSENGEVEVDPPSRSPLLSSSTSVIKKRPRRPRRRSSPFTRSASSPTAARRRVGQAKVRHDNIFRAITGTAGSCPTAGGEECQFPYKDRFGQERNLCTKDPEEVFGVKDSEGGDVSEDSFESFCPTQVDVKTRRPLKWRPCCSSCGPLACPLTSYHTHSQLHADLTDLATRHPRHTRTFVLGQSNLGHPLIGIRISRDLSSMLSENGTRSGSLRQRPRVKLVGNMHGNEPVGRELLLYFARHLLESSSDAEASFVLENVDLHILPTMNPDGFARGEEGKCSGGSYFAGRLNEGRKDLNRDFPDFFEWQRLRSDRNFKEADLYDGRQTETKLLMQWILSGNFVLSANFHDGAVLVNYPWDNYHGDHSKSGVFRTPDHEEFYMVSTAYSLSHPAMPNTTAACEQWGHFQDGVTNGADWYPVFGGMQDFNYLFAGTMEVTVEVSCCKFAHSRRLLAEWNDNKDSLFSYVGQALKGIRGQVSDQAGKSVEGSNIRVRKARRLRTMKEMAESTDWRESFVTTDESGMFWRILVPGVYEVQAVYFEKRNRAGRVINGKTKMLVSDIRRIRVTDEKKQQFINFTLREDHDDSGSSAVGEDFGIRDGEGGGTPQPDQQNHEQQPQIIPTASTSKLSTSESDGQSGSGRKGFVFQ